MRTPASPCRGVLSVVRGFFLSRPPLHHHCTTTTTTAPSTTATSTTTTTACARPYAHRPRLVTHSHTFTHVHAHCCVLCALQASRLRATRNLAGAARQSWRPVRIAATHHACVPCADLCVPIHIARTCFPGNRLPACCTPPQAFAANMVCVCT